MFEISIFSRFPSKDYGGSLLTARGRRRCNGALPKQSLQVFRSEKSEVRRQSNAEYIFR
jgi:hypothetical protein